MNKEREIIINRKELVGQIEQANALTNDLKKAQALQSILVQEKNTPFNESIEKLLLLGINSLTQTITRLTKVEDKALLMSIDALLATATTSSLLSQETQQLVFSKRDLIKDALKAIEIQSGSLAMITQTLSSLVTGASLNILEQKIIALGMSRLSFLIKDMTEKQLSDISQLLKKKVLSSGKLSSANNVALNNLLQEIDILLNRLDKEEAVASFNNTLQEVGQLSPSQIMEELPPHFGTRIFDEKTTKLGHEAINKVYTARDLEDVNQLSEVKTLLLRAQTSPYLKKYQSNYNKRIETLSSIITQLREQELQKKKESLAALDGRLVILRDQEDMAAMVESLNKEFENLAQGPVYEETQQKVAEHLLTHFIPSIRDMDKKQLMQVKGETLPLVKQSRALTGQDKEILVGAINQAIADAEGSIGQELEKEQEEVIAFEQRMSVLERQPLEQKLNLIKQEIANAQEYAIHNPMKERFAQVIQEHFLPLISNFSEKDVQRFQEMGLIADFETTPLLSSDQRKVLSNQVRESLNAVQNALTESLQEEEDKKVETIDVFMAKIREAMMQSTLKDQLKELVGIMENSASVEVYPEMQESMFNALMALTMSISKADDESTQLVKVFLEAMLPSTKLLDDKQKNQLNQAFEEVMKSDESPSADQPNDEAATPVEDPDLDSPDQSVESPTDQVSDPAMQEEGEQPENQSIGQTPTRPVRPRSYSRSRTARSSSSRNRSIAGRESMAKPASTRQVARTVTTGQTARTPGQRTTRRTVEPTSKTDRFSQYQEAGREGVQDLKTRVSARTGTTATERGRQGYARTTRVRQTR